MPRTIKPRTTKRHTPRAHYTPAELQAHDVADLRVDYASTCRSILSWRTNELVQYTQRLKHDTLQRLGHLTLQQGTAIECARCGASGTATNILIGEIFTIACGERAQGSEVTADECRLRAIREHAQALALRARGQLGDDEIAAGHTRTGVDYERRAKEIGGAS